MDLIDLQHRDTDVATISAAANCAEPSYAIQRKRFDSGIVSYWSKQRDLQGFCNALVDAAQSSEFSGIIFFYPQRWADQQIMRDTATRMNPATNFIGCSSSGTLSPNGLENDATLMAILLPANQFTIVSTVLENLDTIGMDDIVSEVHSLKTQLSVVAASTHFNDVFALSLIDGLSYSEEAVTAALHRGLGGLPLVGGSAGDDLQLNQTSQFSNGISYTNSAILTLIKSKLPFRTFTNNNFVPTEHKLVVTDSDPDRRNVREFNARPAAMEYAHAVGLDPDSLTPDSFASHPVVVKVGGEYYCRSIQKCEDDHSLSFFCAIDTGIVLTIAKPTGMVKSTRLAIEELRKELGGLDMIIGFDCILRRLDARNRGNLDDISALYRDANVVGFGTYGEQFNSMHINQTFTGVAFGKPPSRRTG